MIGFVLSHLTVGSDAKVFNKVLVAPQSWPEWKSKVSRPTILAPIAGILCSLHKASQMRVLNSSSGTNRTGDAPGTSGSVGYRGRDSGMFWESLGVVNSTVSGAVHHIQRALMLGHGRQRGSTPRGRGSH